MKCKHRWQIIPNPRGFYGRVRVCNKCKLKMMRKKIDTNRTVPYYRGWAKKFIRKHLRIWGKWEKYKLDDLDRLSIVHQYTIKVENKYYSHCWSGWDSWPHRDKPLKANERMSIRKALYCHAIEQDMDAIHKQEVLANSGATHHKRVVKSGLVYLYPSCE